MSNPKPNKIWVDKGNEFYNRLIKSWKQDNYIEIYSIRNEVKCVFAERFIKTLKNKIYEYITSISKNVSVDKLIDIVDKHKGRGSYSTLIMNTSEFGRAHR